MADALTVDEYEPTDAELARIAYLDEDPGLTWWYEAEDWFADQAKAEQKLLRYAARQQLGKALVQYEAALRAARRHGLDCSRWTLPSITVDMVAAAMHRYDSAFWSAPGPDFEAYAGIVAQASECLKDETREVLQAVALASSRRTKIPLQAVRPIRRTLPSARSRERRRTAARNAAARSPGSKEDADPEPVATRRAA